MTTMRALALAGCCLGMAAGQRVGVPTTDLDKVSVDELFSVEVTSVDRKAQELAKAPAAVFVLTAADIRRSGATSIPEALEVVPGLTVLRLDGRSWVVSARGGARLYSDKMLVMIDGRSVYTPLFSGVLWDTIDVPMDDIEQIEVVRGPGAVMWGPNAVNGVINIITKDARHTKGGQVSASTGNESRANGEVRWGAASGDRLAWRAWGKFDYLVPDFDSPGFYNFDTLLVYREPAVRDLNSATGAMGFRIDGQPGDRDQWLLQGELYKGDRQDPLATPILYPSVIEEQRGHSDYLGGYVQGRWVHSTSPDNERTLLFSYDRSALDYSFGGGTFNNFNANFGWRRQTGERNEFYWGAGFEEYWDRTLTNRMMAFNPQNASYGDGDAVVRDEWQFLPGRLTGSAGVRIDYTSFHQFEYQPSVRLLYTPDAHQSLWSAVSRAIRTPNRVDRDFDESAGKDLIDGFPVALWVLGSKNMRSEVERSVEAGYRYQSGQRWSVDASIFWSYYERLRVMTGSTIPLLSFAGGVPVLSAPVTMCNAGRGRSYGAEIWGTWQVRTGWRISPSYSYLDEDRWLPASSAAHAYFWDGTPASFAHQGAVRAQHDLARNLQFDVTLRAHSRDSDLYGIPGVMLLDARLAWRPWSGGEWSVAAKDLTGREVMEGYPELAAVAIPLRRTLIVKWTQRF